MIPYRWIAGALTALVLLAAIWWHGNRAGAREVQAEWDAETAQRAEQAREDAVMARKASTAYQATLATIQGRTVGLQKELRNALSQTPRSCPATLGDVVVPGAAIDSLRAAGADPSP